MLDLSLDKIPLTMLTMSKGKTKRKRKRKRKRKKKRKKKKIYYSSGELSPKWQCASMGTV